MAEEDAPPQTTSPSTAPTSTAPAPALAPVAQVTEAESAITPSDNLETITTTTSHKPVAAAPGPRATRLHEAYAKVLKRTLNQLKWDNFAGCYPTVGKKGDAVLRQVQGQMIEKLGEKCEKEFDNIMSSRQVVPKLNELEGLIGDAARRRNESSKEDAAPTPPHLLPPTSILAAHMHPSLVVHQSQLNARLQTTQSQNSLLFDQVQRQREEIAALLDQLESVVADVQGANHALTDVVQEIAAEAREGEVLVGEGSLGTKP